MILKGRSFQNAIQFGNLFIDVAIDSVDPAKPCLEWMDGREVPFENLTGLESLVRVAEAHCDRSGSDCANSARQPGPNAFISSSTKMIATPIRLSPAIRPLDTGTV